MNLRLEPVNEENYYECISMPKLDYVASNAVSIAQAYVFKNRYPFCIFDGDKMIGFVMYKIEFEEEEKFYAMNRVYISTEYQNKGYGKEVVRKILKIIKDRHDCKEVYTSTNLENARAFHVYESIGFKRTGEVSGNEGVLVYTFD